MGQSSSLIKKHQELNQKHGAEYVSMALELVDDLYNEKLYKKSAALAAQAFDEAKKIDWKSAMADARFKQARSTARLPRKANKEKALELLEEGFKYAEENDLKRKILEAQRVLAVGLSADKKVAQIEQQLQELQGGGTKRIGGLFRSRRKALEAEKDQLAQELESLTDEQQQLKAQLDAREEVLEKLTADQMRKELLLSEQARLLDSLAFTALLDSLELANKNIELREKAVALEKLDAELALRNSQRNFYLALAGVVFLMSIGLFLRNRAMKRYNAILEEKNRIIDEEKQRSESLLLNILPENVANELKTHGAAKARRFEDASVMFLDFKGFTAIAKKMSPEELVADLHEAFSAFDEIVAKHGVEKIKTIGDAYMCAAGLGDDPKAATRKIIAAAKEIQSFLNDWNAKRKSSGRPEFHARIGIHSGPVVAGVVGKRKFAYDIWGDTVNVAARMESAGKAGKINISTKTHQLLKDDFRFEPRGKISIKNAGEVEMYFLEESLSADRQGGTEESRN
ncbi:MAG: hypothetical protein Kow0027_23380 [Saprospiraceae bacterium]